MNGEAESAGKSSGGSLAKSLGSTFKKAFIALGIGKVISDVVGNTSEFETGMAKVKTLFSGTGEEFNQLTEDILAADQVFLVGVGRVMLALQCVCKRLAHLGIKAHYVGEITEPAITKNDLLIVGSGSGGSLFPLGIAKKARSAVDCKIVHIGSNPNSEMKDIADYMVRIPVRTKFYLEDEVDSCQIMTSLFEQSVLLLGDIIAKMIVEEKQLDMKALWRCHANLE